VKLAICRKQVQLLMSLFAFACATAFAQAPQLTSISPTAISSGMQITLTGTGFGATQGVAGAVKFVVAGNASIVSWSNTQIVAIVPSGLVSAGNVTVYQNNQSSNGVAFTVIPPVLNSISSTALAPGMQVTLTGSGFRSTQWSGLVFIDTAQALIVSWSDTQIVATVPSVALSSGNVKVWQYSEYSNGVPFTAITPVLTSISPTALSPGDLPPAFVHVRIRQFSATPSPV